MRGVALALVVVLAACGSRSDTAHDRVLYVRHEGADMMVWVRGNVASGRLLVVVHGGPGGESTTYAEDLHPLEAELAVAYWDQRASGASRGTFPASRYTYPQFGEDLGAVVRALEFAYAPRDVFVMGHSFGVEVGTEFLVAGDNQDRITGWIPVNGTFSVTAHVDGLCDHITERVTEIEANPDAYALPEEDLATIRGWRAECVVAPFTQPLDRAVLDTVWDRSLALPLFPVEAQPYDPFYPPWWTSPVSARAQAVNDRLVFPPMDDAYLDFERGDDLGQVTLPTLLLWGRHDNIIPRLVGERYHAALGTPDADKRLVLFDHSYHSPMYEEQGRFLDEVRAFVGAYAGE